MRQPRKCVEEVFGEHGVGCSLLWTTLASAASRGPSQQGAEASREPSGVCHKMGGSVMRTVTTRFLRAVGAAPAVSQHALLPSGGSARHNLSMGRKDKGREIC